MSYLITPSTRRILMKTRVNGISDTIFRATTSNECNSTSISSKFDLNHNYHLSQTRHYISFPSHQHESMSTTSSLKYFLQPIDQTIRMMSSTGSPDEKSTESSETTSKESSQKVEEEPPKMDTLDTDNESAQEEEQPIASKEHQLEIKQLKDQLLRSIAEQENTRRIAKRDVDSARQYAISSFAKNLLDTAYNLDAALESVPLDLLKKDEKEDKKYTKLNQTLTTLYEGIQMTQAGLLKSFEKNSLSPYGSVGDVFDPHFHEALYEYAEKDSVAGSVGMVVKKGYKLHGRTIRPAKVGVIKKE